MLLSRLKAKLLKRRWTEWLHSRQDTNLAYVEHLKKSPILSSLRRLKLNAFSTLYAMDGDQGSKLELVLICRRRSSFFIL